MPYVKIRFDFEYCEKDRFFRTLLVKKNLNLLSFGIAIVKAFKGELTHSFTFDTKEISYIPPYFEYTGNGEKYMQDYTVEDLGKKFTFCYDLGECWYFKAKVYSKEIDEVYKDGNGEEQEVVLIDGVGQGIWEDNKETFVKYLKGEIEPNSCKENEKLGIYKPWNFKIKKFSDFDTKFNLEDEKYEFYDSYLRALIEFCDGEYFNLLMK